MKNTKKTERFLYEKPELKEIDLLLEEDVAKGVGSGAQLPDEPAPPDPG
ncbi:MAG: hypothetical protein HN356_13365 [Calditrichaeota bacterium]|jgi:hypothetical protein|nr:hypothetical protein [Calditrichota bacterium]MBT7617199.1 hypothetical protein [Calditrichota bacterium]MBT7788658.1 hypothetical protein [Calditrichota bacterium]